MTVGTTIAGRFRVDQVLGAGGMGIVVSAMHLELGHRVAIKVLRDEMAANPTIVERFLREARAVVQLRTEHVCRVLDVGRLDTGAPYIVMELLDGTDLARVVARQPLPVTVAVEYVLQASVAIAEAHAAGIVHRDLKPANLFVTRRLDGGPLIKVLDFGIAKAMTGDGAQLTRSHSMMGSPGYVSPEQLQSARDVDVRTDIWALGVTLYHLLSARLPFYRPNAAEMAVRIATEPPDPLDVPPALRAAVFRCLEKSPAQRYADVAVLAADLVPFGGPSARAIASVVGQVIRRSVSPPEPLPVVPPSAPTAASIAVGPTFAAPSKQPPTSAPAVPRPRPVTGAPPAPRHRPATDAPPAAAQSMPDGRSRRLPWWWIVAPVIVLTAAVTSAFHWCSRPEPPAPSLPTVRVVAAAPTTESPAPDAREPVTVAPIDAGVVETPAWLLPRDAGAIAPPAVPGSRPLVPRDPPPGGPAPRVVASPDARTPDAKPPEAKPQDAGPQRPGKLGKLKRFIGNKVRQVGCKLEGGATADLVTCWCGMHDQPRAQAAFARLTGPDREKARAQCATEGIQLR